MFQLKQVEVLYSKRYWSILATFRVNERVKAHWSPRICKVSILEIANLATYSHENKTSLFLLKDDSTSESPSCPLHPTSIDVFCHSNLSKVENIHVFCLSNLTNIKYIDVTSLKDKLQMIDELFILFLGAKDVEWCKTWVFESHHF